MTNAYNLLCDTFLRGLKFQKHAGNHSSTRQLKGECGQQLCLAKTSMRKNTHKLRPEEERSDQRDVQMYWLCERRFREGFKRSGHRYRLWSSGQTSRRCRSRVAHRPYCHGRWCGGGIQVSALVGDSPPFRGDRSSRKCRRIFLEEVSSFLAACRSCRRK